MLHPGYAGPVGLEVSRDGDRAEHAEVNVAPRQRRLLLGDPVQERHDGPVQRRRLLLHADTVRVADELKHFAPVGLGEFADLGHHSQGTNTAKR